MTIVVEVKNSGRAHSETGWLARWKKAKNYDENAKIKCSNKKCNKYAEHGGHVIKANSKDKKEYIVPLCAQCNNPNNTESFKVNSSLMIYAQDL